MSVKPEGLLRDNKSTTVFHHPSEFQLFIFTFYIINQVSDFQLHISLLIFMLFGIKSD